MTRTLDRCLSIWTAAICLALAQAAPVAGAVATPPFPFSIVAADYRDLDGDHDPFPDAGETGRVVFTIRNGQKALTGVSFVLESSDPGVACISERRVAAASLAPGQEIVVGSLDPGSPGFTFRTSDTLTSPAGADPARVELCLRVQANEFGPLSNPICTRLAAAVDLPAGVTQTFIPGPDGVPSSADDGTFLESFDLDRNADGQFTVADTFRMTDGGTGLTGHGFYARGTNGPAAPDAIPGVACGGFQTPPQGNPMCALEPNFAMDWHLHCPPGATNCPNLETGTCVPTSSGHPCSFKTPTGGQKALSTPNSLHMGAHYAPLDTAGDSTHLRSLQGFVSSPLNLALFPRPGDLELSMFQIADLIDSNTFGPTPGPQCMDCGDVQVQIDTNPDPAVDDWGFWEKLTPFQNVYDHVMTAWSTFSPYYCEFTPADTGTAPPAPRGVHETFCFPQGAWSHCGMIGGTAPGSVGNCAGPGYVDPSGKGVWVETKFNLAQYLGQRIRVRWIGSTWMAGSPLTTSYFDWAGIYCDPDPCPTYTTDDGWWLDDIRLTGLLTSQTTPSPDTRAAPPTTCPASCADEDGDGFGAPGSALCAAGPQTDCNDLDPRVRPGAVEGCNGIDDDCDGTVPAVELDADGDGWRVCAGDCDDNDPFTYPDALETDDGRDNQCAGNPGYGIVDELPTPIRFYTKVQIFWDAMDGAQDYLGVRSTRRDFSQGCILFPSTNQNATIMDADNPPLGTVFYYLVRPETPYAGSWGQDSSGQERTGICGL